MNTSTAIVLAVLGVAVIGGAAYVLTRPKVSVQGPTPSYAPSPAGSGTAGHATTFTPSGSGTSAAGNLPDWLGTAAAGLTLFNSIADTTGLWDWNFGSDSAFG